MASCAFASPWTAGSRFQVSSRTSAVSELVTQRPKAPVTAEASVSRRSEILSLVPRERRRNIRDLPSPFRAGREEVTGPAAW